MNNNSQNSLMTEKLKDTANSQKNNLNNSYTYVHIKDGISMDDWQPEEIPGDEKIDLKIPSNNIKELFNKVFIPDWQNKPADLPAVLKLAGSSILTYQNISSIIAAPGFGKSSICESILASQLNPDVDCMGFKVAHVCEGIIFIDFERTNSDVWKSFDRMCRRAGIKYGEEISNVKIAGMRQIPRLKERLDAIEYLLQTYPCNLLLLDGTGDMVTDTNDLPQAIECRIFLRELTIKHNLSILTTMHPNPSSTKPRGHIGSEILRESECVLLVKKGKGGSMIITSDFEHGKNRNNTSVTAAYKWNGDHHMFVSVDVEKIAEGIKDAKAQLKRENAKKIAENILQMANILTDAELIKAIMQHKSVSESTAKRIKRDMIKWDIITKRKDGCYQLEL